MPRPYKRGKRSLAPRVYEGGCPDRGGGEKLAPRVHEGGAPIGAGGQICYVVGGALPRPYRKLQYLHAHCSGGANEASPPAFTRGVPP